MGLVRYGYKGLATELLVDTSQKLELKVSVQNGEKGSLGHGSKHGGCCWG